MLTRRERTPLRKLMFLGAMAGGKLVEDTATGNPLKFVTDVNKPLKSLVANFLPIQASGTPSPENVLPITGWTGVKVYHGADQTDYDTYHSTFPSAIYGGYVDLITGEVWKTWETVDMGTLRWLATGTSTTGIYRMYTPSLADVIEIPESNSVVGKVLCSVYQSRSADSTYSKNMGVSVARNKSVLVYDADYNTDSSMDDFISAVTGQTLAYGLASPVLITTLTPQQINAIKGNNTVWSDANGDCSVVYLKKG